MIHVIDNNAPGYQPYGIKGVAWPIASPLHDLEEISGKGEWQDKQKNKKRGDEPKNVEMERRPDQSELELLGKEVGRRIQ